MHSLKLIVKTYLVRYDSLSLLPSLSLFLLGWAVSYLRWRLLDIPVYLENIF